MKVVTFLTLRRTFHEKYAPNKMELASRDVVAKAIEDEIAAGRGFGSGLNAYVVVTFVT